MATVALPAARSPRFRALRKIRDAVTGAAITAASAHKASLARLADMPLSVLGAAGIDFAAFHVSHGVGWLVTGVSLFVVEHMIADDDDSRAA